MKFFLLAMVAPVMLFAQESAVAIPGFYQHDGFYLSMSIGPEFGKIDLDAQNTSFHQMSFSGGGGTFDFKIGAAIVQNAIVSFDIIARNILSPDITIDNTKYSSIENLSANDATYGVGFTYYFMPINMFANCTFGVGKFSLQEGNGSASTTANSEPGFSFHLKVGKEWWVSKNWGLGVSAGFGHVDANDKSEPLNPLYSGKMSTDKIFVLFNTTYN